MSSIFDTLVTDRDSSELYYEYTDLNRVEEAAKTMAELLTNSGYPCIGNYKLDWKPMRELATGDFDPNEWQTNTQMKRYLDNLKLIRKQYHNPITATLPEDMNFLSYVIANNLEKFILMVYNDYNNMQKGYKYCGMVTCGSDSLPQ